MQTLSFNHCRERVALSVMLGFVLGFASLAAQAQGWPGYALNAQHTALSTVAADPLKKILWSTPIDLAPVYNGSDLLIHYGSPLITPNNTVILPVKTGHTGGFQFEGLVASTGATKWVQYTDYIFPPHDWTPSCEGTLTPQGTYFFPGAGGTVLYRTDPDDYDPTNLFNPIPLLGGGQLPIKHVGPPHPTPIANTGRLAFYGLKNYWANPAVYDANVYICTPITADSQGNLYFGYYVTGPTPISLESGIARISASGEGTWTPATIAANDSTMTKVVYNCAPALSNDGSTLYVAISNSTPDNGNDWGMGYLVALNSTTLAPIAQVRLKDTYTPANDAYLPDDGSSTPTVGPDGDVYFGVYANDTIADGSNNNGYKGWMLHFSGDLSQTKIAGEFGWDDSSAIVPASAVPSYTGTSSYLIATKYNNYAGPGTGGNGKNKVAILDPNASMIDSRSGATVMKEVITVLGVTPDPDYDQQYPGAVREWCVNTIAIDPITKCAILNSEDGNVYRWDFTSNTLTQHVTLTAGIGEAYTSTVIGPDGTIYAISNALLFAVSGP